MIYSFYLIRSRENSSLVRKTAGMIKLMHIEFVFGHKNNEWGNFDALFLFQKLVGVCFDPIKLELGVFSHVSKFRVKFRS